MQHHINAWPVIELELGRRRRTQRELAVFLGVTPPAVTLAKRGRLVFSLAQLAAVCDFFKFSASEAEALFSEALSARLLRSLARSGFAASRWRGLRVSPLRW